ncbi:lysozyme [Nitrospira sp. BLG_2]|uniref:lysozyme n=1 Tax=Nitrospira sp. BLG_2 TaxID=3397507 RepID=UPI003B998343
MNNVPLDDDFYDFIKGWEQFRGKAYPDEGGIPTIGYGTTVYNRGELVKMGDMITLEEAEHELKEGCKSYYRHMLKVLKAEQSKRQLIALLSLCYNIGVPDFVGSTLLKHINSGVTNREVIATQFRRWVHVGHKVSDGLVRRREAEILCYFMVDTPA